MSEVVHLTLKDKHMIYMPGFAAVFFASASSTTSRNTNKNRNMYRNYGSLVWWSGMMVSALASINEVNLRRAWLVLRWVTVFGFNSR